MSITERIQNHLELDSNSVWRLPGQEKFNYSEGEYQEDYLRTVFRKARDLSSTSYELERYIRDWPSEYHLSRKRTQLLREFSFNRGDKVLEVGCGCGAITRFLGETFDDVIAIEGSLARASLARLRTKDLPGVAIVNSPFQKIQFKTKFDLIFCVGVFEYSKSFIDGADPFDFVLRHFADILNPGGAVVIAIENQFGLKYFDASAEDHTDILFDGIEGYPRRDRERTFGYNELKELLGRYFENIQFHYPYPDYKLPTCILSEEAFASMKLGELVGNFTPRDYAKELASRFDQRLVLMELDRNHELPFFSNSFLVVAGKSNESRVRFNQLGVLFSDRSRSDLQTIARFHRDEKSALVVSKGLQQGPANDAGDAVLRFQEYREPWVDTISLQTQLLRKVKLEQIEFDVLFAPCRIWLQKMRSLAVAKDGELFVDGRYVDCVWANSFIVGDDCVLIDQEWVWRRPIRLNVLVVRSIYYFLHAIRTTPHLNAQFVNRGTHSLILRIALSIGAEVAGRDIREFRELETEFGLLLSGQNSPWRGSLGIRLMLVDRRWFVWWEKARAAWHWVVVRARFRVYRVKRWLGVGASPA